MNPFLWRRFTRGALLVSIVQLSVACDDDVPLVTTDAMSDSSGASDSVADIASHDADVGLMTDSAADTAVHPGDTATPDLGDGKVGDAGEVGDAGDAGLLRARAVLDPTTDGGVARGTVDFVEEGGVTTVTVHVSGATPGLHGMHIHQNASCDATDAGPGQASGGHWNPTDASHGFPEAGVHHAGDFGNITVGEDGTGMLSFTTDAFYLHAGPDSAVGHAVVFHAGTDDGMTQPTGNSGARPACGAIVLMP